jgi:mono/diheme cytochrome c family protein
MSRKTLAVVSAATLSLIVPLSPAAAEDFAAGRTEYLAACAACHGEAADGNGPIASMFSGRVPALTNLAAANDGVFPTLAVMQIIDGRTAVRAHGDPMPLFGNRYEADAVDTAGIYGAEQIVRARLTELVLYLQSIQE